MNLDEKAAKSLEAIVKEIANSGRGDAYSSAFIEEQVNDVVSKLAGLPSAQIKSAITLQVQSLVTTLTQTQLEEYKVTMPVSGVRVWPHLSVVKVGRCQIYSLANHKENRWLGKLALNKKISHFLKFSPPGGSQYWIKTTVRAAKDDSEKREELARDYIHKSLALLMLYSVLEKNAMIFLPKLPMIEIGPRKYASNNAYVTETDQPYWAGESFGSTTLPELALNDEALKAFSQLEFEKVSAILSADSHSEVEQAILDSISVLYSSFSSSDPVWRYIGLVTSLERLLTMPREGSIKRNLAERLAWVLGESSTPEYRRGVQDRLEEIYGRRSEFIHQTTKIETLSADILDLHLYTLSLVATLSEGRFNTISDLKQWVAGKMLGF